LTSAVYQLVLQDELSELEKIDKLLSELQQKHDLTPKRFFALKLCAHEAITNIVTHGFDERNGHRIEVAIAVEGDEISLTIVDNGSPFNPLKVPTPTRPADIETSDIGGHGIHLMRSFSKEMVYNRVGSENRLVVSV
jgi:serine/threonine-protein kinase RsbW